MFYVVAEHANNHKNASRLSHIKVLCSNNFQQRGSVAQLGSAKGLHVRMGELSVWQMSHLSLTTELNNKEISTALASHCVGGGQCR